MNKEDLKPIVINSVNDIRKAISPFIREVAAGKVDITSDVEWVDEDNKKHVSTVNTYSSDVNMRQNLLDGFDQVKAQLRMWEDMHDVLQEDEYATTLPRADIDSIYMPIDKIIKYRLGGAREGLTVVWMLEDRKVVFDPYTKKLEETMKDDHAT